MIGIVVVSHSRALADAAVGLAEEMVAAEARPGIRVAAGLDETTFGTDAAAIAEAITDVDSADGVLVLLDLGSAVLSAEMALEFIDPETAERVRISPAPLVEGLVAAVVTASTGASLAEVAAEAEGGLAAKAEHLGVETAAPEPAESAEPVTVEGPATEVVVRNPHGLHARPAAALVSGLRGLDATVLLRNATLNKGPATARSVGKVAALGLLKGHTLAATFSGPDAGAARERFLSLAAADFGESEEPAASAPPAAPADPARTGRQVVIGPALVRGGDVDTGRYAPGTPEDEKTRLESAVETVTAALAGLAIAVGPQRGIFEAQEALLGDPDLAEGLAADTASGTSAVDAVRARFGAVAADFDALTDPYLRERGQDVRSLERQVLQVLVGSTDQTTPGTPHILVVDELDAATAAGLDPATTLGVVTTTGGATGHGVIVASSRGIPVLTGRSEAKGVAEGTLIGIDPGPGTLWLDPDAATQEEIRRLSQSRGQEAAEAATRSHEAALTTSGRRVLVEANIASLADAVAGAAAGAEGSGLVRTEILFAHHATSPDAATQAAALVEIGKALGAPITVRTWDPGGDKPLPFLVTDGEANPMLGERGLRAMRRYPDVFAEQLRGIVAAAREVSVRVMFPMVTEPDEVVWARSVLADVLAEHPNPPSLEVGIMVEVPAAALRADEFAPLVDFASIGTNDLAQYTTAVDRGNGRVAHLSRPSSAIWALIFMTCQAFGDKPVAVCGDLASDPDLTAT
ncbi:MAG TPA: dihydroxyacetone kinase phosphoryl donor subunit DhaM, partial [Coriobacteriia bacterium]